jgi:hypothetical protein
MKKIKLFKDILKTKTTSGALKYSQGRVYLFIFILAYISALTYFILQPNDYMQTIVDALQWAILLFAAYVFGGKGVEATKNILGKEDKSGKVDKKTLLNENDKTS